MDPLTDNPLSFSLGSLRRDWLRPDVLLYEVEGDLDECQDLAEGLAKTVRKDTAEHSPHHILFDLTGVEFVRGAGWAFLSVALRHSRTVDGSVRVIFGPGHTPSVRRHFHQNGFPQVVPEYESVEAAMAVLESASSGPSSIAPVESV